MSVNRNGLIECKDCGETVHVKHAKGGRCGECHESYEDCEVALNECPQDCAADCAAFVPALVTGQPAFMPSYATTEHADHAERYATDGRYGGYVGVEVKPSSGVWRLEQEEVAT